MSESQPKYNFRNQELSQYTIGTCRGTYYEGEDCYILEKLFKEYSAPPTPPRRRNDTKDAITWAAVAVTAFTGFVGFCFLSDHAQKLAGVGMGTGLLSGLGSLLVSEKMGRPYNTNKFLIRFGAFVGFAAGIICGDKIMNQADKLWEGTRHMLQKAQIGVKPLFSETIDSNKNNIVMWPGTKASGLHELNNV